MELYKWYKGDELPDRECDCVVVFKEWYGNVGNVRLYKSVGRYKKSWDGYFFLDQKGYEINPLSIIAWMPIEFPKEVS